MASKAKGRVLAPVQATVRPLELAQHELQVELVLPAEAVAEGAVAALPAWTPGSYLVRDYARLLDRVELADAEGRRLPTPKLDKQRWQLPPLPRGGRLRYRLFANDLSVRTNHADGTHAFLTGAATFLYLEGQLQRPYEVRFEGFPGDWTIATGLDAHAGAYWAGDYDTLVDSPFELGHLRVHHWEEQGARFEFAFQGGHNADETVIAEGTRKIVAEAGRLFGGFPFERYVFLLTFSPKAGGGLEHKTSTALLADPHVFAQAEGYHQLFGLISHEFFHVWNVKHLHDPVLGPFDYSRETPTALLWFHEGFTDYMDNILALRAGVMPWSFLAKEWGQRWTDNLQRPGRQVQSLQEASWDAWIRGYKPNEFTANSTVDYYGLGSLAALMMEGRLRQGSGGQHGVADLMARLWARRSDKGVTDADLRALYAELSGEAPDAFWKAVLEGPAQLDATAIEGAFGLVFEAKAPWEALSAEDLRDPLAVAAAKAWTGLVFAKPGAGAEAPVIQNVIPGSPAYAAGLSYGQEVLAVEGWRTPTATDVQRRLADVAVGGQARVTVADRGRLREVAVAVVEHPGRIIRIVPDPKATEAQKAAFQGWTGQPHPPLPTASAKVKGRR